MTDDPKQDWIDMNRDKTIKQYDQAVAEGRWAKAKFAALNLKDLDPANKSEWNERYREADWQLHQDLNG